MRTTYSALLAAARGESAARAHLHRPGRTPKWTACHQRDRQPLPPVVRRPRPCPASRDAPRGDTPPHHTDWRNRLRPCQSTNPRRAPGQPGKTRQEGYAAAFEETIPGVNTIAAPIRDASAAVTAVLSVSGPA